MSIKPFRSAYVTDPTHDMSAISAWVEDIHFILKGTETYAEIPAAVAQALKDFSPEKDVIIPVGGIVANFVMAMILTNMLDRSVTLTIGSYRKGYEFYRLELKTNSLNAA